nr:hypothetical protein [Desulfobacula sp.]
MERETVLRRRVDIIHEGLKKTANVKVNVESLRQAKIHALLSLGDQKAADVLESAAINGWPSAMKENKAYCDEIVYGEKSPDSPLPWDFLDNRIKKDFLAGEFKKAEREKSSASCPMADCRICKTCM